MLVNQYHKDSIMKNVIITGASKGIGRATALRFAGAGYSLAVCARHIEGLLTLKEEIVAINPSLKVWIQSCDVSDAVSIKKFGIDAMAALGEIDVLVNNAGVYLPGNVMDEDELTLRTLIATNLYSAYDLTRVVAPSMVARKSGHIINICSIASLVALTEGGSYSISKFALRGFNTVLREELKTTGVKVTAVMPGATWSASWDGVDLPKERLMDAADIADAIYDVTTLSPKAVVEEILIRPQLGDL
jgi:short-subunit dehydrogenase